MTRSEGQVVISTEAGQGIWCGITLSLAKEGVSVDVGDNANAGLIRDSLAFNAESIIVNIF